MAESRAPQSTLAFHLWKEERFSARKNPPGLFIKHFLPASPAGTHYGPNELLWSEAMYCCIAIRSLANGDLHRIWCSTSTRWSWICTKQEKAAVSTSRATNSCLLGEQPVQSFPVPCAGPYATTCSSRIQELVGGSDQQASRSGHW